MWLLLPWKGSCQVFAVKGAALEESNVNSDPLARNDLLFWFVYKDAASIKLDYFQHKKDDLMIMKKGKAEIPSIDIDMRND